MTTVTPPGMPEDVETGPAGTSADRPDGPTNNPGRAVTFETLEVTVQYLLLATEDEAAFNAREDAELSGQYWESWQGYIKALTDSGVLTGAGGLLPPWTATTLRVREGERLVQDGPYAETKEQLGGYFVIEVPDLDAALAWAERCPSAGYASVEVRPLLPMRP